MTRDEAAAAMDANQDWRFDSSGAKARAFVAAAFTWLRLTPTNSLTSQRADTRMQTQIDPSFVEKERDLANAFLERLQAQSTDVTQFADLPRQFSFERMGGGGCYPGDCR